MTSSRMAAKPKKNRMVKFKMKELSAVDRPAQQGALVSIMKRDDGDDEGLEKHCGRVPVLTSADEGHVHMIWLDDDRGGSTSWQTSEGDEQGHSHPWIINPDGTLTIGEEDGHTHEVSAESVLAAMRELFISEHDTPVVAVDVVFAQHADGMPDEEKEDLLKSLSEKFPIRCLSDLHNAIAALDHADSQDQAVNFIEKVAQALDLESELPEEFAAIAKTIGPGDGGQKKGSKMKPGSTEKVSKAEGADDAAKEENTKLSAQLEVAKAFGALNDEQKSYHKGLGDEDAEAFLKLDDDGRSSEIEAKKASINVIYKAADGSKYTSADDPRLVTMAKAADETAKALAKSNALTKNAEYSKRAGSELANLPGDETTKVALLKAVDTIKDEDTRGKVSELFKAANGNLSKAFRQVGTRDGGADSSGSDSADADSKLTDLAKARQLKEGGDFFDHYEKVGEENPELLAKAVG